MSSAKADCEALMNWLLPFAKQLLGQHGEFHPYGGAMQTDGNLKSVFGWDGDEHPPAAELIRLIKDGFIACANDGSFKATALVYDVRIALSPNGETSDAIAVSMNHRDNYSVVVLLPYRIDNGRVIYDQVMARPGEADVFFQS